MRRSFKTLLTALFIFSFSSTLRAQTTELPAQPKLVVGIVVDQMAYEFLYRYADLYSDGGFEKLMRDGFSCEEAHFNYIPTYTGPGHTCIYTGSVPAVDGIISNEWFDRTVDSSIYVTTDNSVKGVGTNSIAGKMSPKNLLVTTIGDQLKLSDQQHSKVIGVALKDRSSILPAGHSADAAFWYDGSVNGWVTSSYYMNDLPQWLKNYNATNPAAAYLNQNWNLLLPKSSYWNSTADSVSWETTNLGEPGPKFPHYLAYTANSDVIRPTPFGNTITKDFAEQVIKNENLGKGKYTDMICISFSSTDYVGHTYGPHSMEIEDTYLRLDRDLAEFISFLDANVGKGNYVLFLTADHGVSPVPAYLNTLKIQAGLINEAALKMKMDSVMNTTFGKSGWIKAYENQQVYLNDSLMQAEGVDREKIFSALHDFIISQKGVANCFLTADQSDASLPDGFKSLFNNSIYPKRSGDIQIIYDPYYESWFPTGTTHGSNYVYDTHVPLLFYGWKIPKGKSYDPVHITDIAPTIAALLHITEPNGCVGTPIEEVLK